MKKTLSRIIDTQLLFFYKAIILQWEFDWKNNKFNTNFGNLKTYERENNLLLKCFENISDLEEEAEGYINHFRRSREYSGVMLFNRTDNKPKAILRHLRNISAHGHFQSRIVNKIKCIGFKHFSEKDNRLRAIGFIPYEELKPLLKAIMSTKI